MLFGGLCTVAEKGQAGRQGKAARLFSKPRGFSYGINPAYQLVRGASIRMSIDYPVAMASSSTLNELFGVSNRLAA
jgi:hypothetical protein